MNEEETIMLIEDEVPYIYHVISKKVGELGILYKPEGVNRYCFK